MQVGIIADSHINSKLYGRYKDNVNLFSKYQLEAFEWVLQQYKDMGVKTVISCGDLFDTVNVDPYFLLRVSELVKDFNFITIAGNHEVNSFYIRNEMYNCNLLQAQAIITKTKMSIGGVNFVFAPWGEVVDEGDLEDGKNVLIAHGLVRDYGYDEDTIKNMDLFNLVIAGHRHIPEEFCEGKTRYLVPGSMSEYACPTAFVPKYWVLDTDDLSYEGYEIENNVRTIWATSEDDLKDIDLSHKLVVYSSELDMSKIDKYNEQCLNFKYAYNKKEKAEKPPQIVADFWADVKKNKPEWLEEFQEKVKE